MKLIFNKITIENFMSIVSKEITLSENYNEFLGFNGVGKTTILSAINWCLFGKDYYDKRDFDIFTIDKYEGVQKSLKPHVEIEVSFNDETYTISRKLYGDRNLTLLEVNGLKLKTTTEYPQFLREKLSINEEEFKMLSNITYAINLPQNDLKKLITNLVGDLDDNEMFEMEDIKKKYGKLEEKIKTVGTEILAKNISQTKTSKDKQLLETIGAIKQEESNIEKVNFDDIQVDNLIKRREELYQINDDYGKKVDEENAKKKAIDDMNSEIRNKENELENMKKEFALKNVEGKNIKSQIEQLSNVEIMRNKDRNEINLKIQNIQYKLKDIENRLKKIQNNKTSIVEEFNLAKSKVITVDSDVCEMCGQKLPQSMIDDILKRKQDRHNNYLKELKNKNDELKNEIDKLNIEKKSFDDEIKDYTSKLKEVENKDYTNLVIENENINKLNLEIQNKRNECIELQKKMKDLSYNIGLLKDKVKLLPMPSIVPSIENAKIELENINNKLANFEYIETHKGNLKDLKEKKDKLDKDKISLNYLEQLLKDYNSKKSEIMTKRLEDSFKHIKFKTEELNKGGNVVSCFKVTMNGKDFYTLSGGEKMRASIDMVCGIQRLKNKNIPLLIDQMGELDEFPKWVDTQVVCCRAIQKPREDNPNYSRLMTTYSELQLLKR